jgi:hypothetical protein
MPEKLSTGNPAILPTTQEPASWKPKSKLESKKGGAGRKSGGQIPRRRPSMSKMTCDTEALGAGTGAGAARPSPESTDAIGA